MPVEIEKPSVSFTDESMRALQHSLDRLERRIRARAADSAIKARGTPSEVTGSDIEKAFREIVAPNTRYLLEERNEIERRHLLRASHMHLLSTFYIIFGAFIAFCGTLYPFVRTQLLNPTGKLSVLVAMGGVLMVAIGFSLRTYLRYREYIRKEERLRRYPRSIEYPLQRD